MCGGGGGGGVRCVGVGVCLYVCFRLVGACVWCVWYDTFVPCMCMSVCLSACRSVSPGNDADRHLFTVCAASKPSSVTHQ